MYLLIFAEVFLHEFFVRECIFAIWPKISKNCKNKFPQNLFLHSVLCLRLSVMTLNLVAMQKFIINKCQAIALFAIISQ